MAEEDKRPALLAAILALNPCHDQKEAGTIAKWSEHWPKDVTLAWLLRNPRRGDHTVTARDRIWMASRLLRLKGARRFPANDPGLLAKRVEELATLAEGWEPNSPRPNQARRSVARAERIAARAAARDARRPKPEAPAEVEPVIDTKPAARPETKKVRRGFLGLF